MEKTERAYIQMALKTHVQQSLFEEESAYTEETLSAPQKEEHWHTASWYKEHFGADPIKLGLPYKEVKNPYYRCATPMRLWKEEDVLPHRSERGIQQHAKRKEAGVKGFQKRKTNLVEWFKEIKTSNPQVQEITKRLWEIGEKIRLLHDQKAECRQDGEDNDYWDTGIDHCAQCYKWSQEQHFLREERAQLFEKLVATCGKDKKTIQLARKWLREQGTNSTENTPYT